MSLPSLFLCMGEYLGTHRILCWDFYTDESRLRDIDGTFHNDGFTAQNRGLFARLIGKAKGLEGPFF